MKESDGYEAIDAIPERDPEVDAEAHAEFKAAMAQAAAALMERAIDGSSITIGVTGRDDERLYVDDIRQEFNCGRSKAYRILQTLPSHKDGRQRYVFRREVDAYIAEHGGVDVLWQ